jgi:multidrug efflux system membrane fusion protein
VADVSGVITAVEAEPGQVVTAGTPVVRIAAGRPARRGVLRARRQGRRHAPGHRGAGAALGQQRQLTGRIREVAASADPVTRTYPVKVALEGATQPPLGATVTVRRRR